MPELPDVETFKRYLDATSLYQEIVDIEVRSPALMEEIEVEALVGKLRGQSFVSTRRHGKWLFVELDSNGWLVLHFGMSGHLAYFKDMEKDPPYDRFLVTFANGYHLAYDASRKLGEIEITQNPKAFVQEKGLGPDVLDPDFDRDAFLETLKGRRGMIKSALMDQQLMAGIGNVYSDEILFQARFHPRTEVGQLDEQRRIEIYGKLQEVLHTAIEHQAAPEEFPDSYLTPHRHAEGTCPVCGGAIDRVQVSGRTAYFCPSCQQKKSKEKA